MTKLESLNNNKKLLPQQVAEQIMNLIMDRELKSGDKLPNEFEMAQQLSVGRGTIREAVKILVSRNVLEIKRGRGTFVCRHPGMVDDPLGFAFVKDKKKLALDLCEVRLMIEPEIAALAALRATEQEVRELQEIEDQVADLCSRGEQHMEKDIEFHEKIAKISKNSVMPKLVPVIQAGVSVFIQVTDLALVRDTVRTHQLVVDAIRDRDSERARAAMVEHLQANRDKIEDIFGKN